MLKNINNKYKIGDNYFKTQDEAKRYVRSIVSNCRHEINQNEEMFEVIHDIIKCHRYYESKRGNGIKQFIFVTNPLNKCRELNIVRIDNTICSISYVVCAEDSIIDKSKLKEHKITFPLYEAMRIAINDQILNYRNEQYLSCGLQCVLCEIRNTQFHVDHNNPSFKTLRDNFLLNREHPVTFNKTQDTHASIFKPQDEQFKNEWVEYHLQNARLQILCKSCNLRKSKKDDIIINSS